MLTGNYPAISMRGRSSGKESRMDPKIITAREKVVVPATPPVPWRREINMPPQAWFRGEWLPARWEREAQEELAEKRETAKKWLRFVLRLLTGIVLTGGSLAVYIRMLMLIGTP